MISPVRVRGGVAGILACACVSLPAWSADAAPVASLSFMSLLQVLLGLGVVLGVIAATAWLLRRLGPGQVSGAGAMRVVGGVAVGPKERVVVVDVEDVRMILGVAPGQVSLLHQMPRPEGQGAVETAGLPGPFRDKLKQLLQPRRESPHAD